jgi:hypothetical protein
MAGSPWTSNRQSGTSFWRNASPEAKVRLDLNNPVFQEQLLTLHKVERHAVLDTLNKIRQLAWNQLYRDKEIKWEKITSLKPPVGIDAVYSLRISKSPRTTTHRDGDFIRLLTISPHHPATDCHQSVARLVDGVRLRIQHYC